MGGKYFFDKIPPEERKKLAEICGLTEEESQVIEIRARKDRVIPTAMEFGMSDSTIKRRSRSAAQKIARCAHRDCKRADFAEKIG
jgi:hypothetical protein